MEASNATEAVEHLTPHDLVTYFRCPHEMELLHAIRTSRHTGVAISVRTPPDSRPVAHSPLFPPSTSRTRAVEGRLELTPSDVLVYRDEAEADLPMLFAPESDRPESRFQGHGGNLVDDHLGIAGRPDFIVRHANGGYTPIEYKSTHLFLGFGPNEAHGRMFDVIQSIAECHLVEACTGVRPLRGVVLYGDRAGQGRREGFVEVAYGEPEAAWLRAALRQIRADATRVPVASERTCPTCAANREHLCRFASSAVTQSGGFPERNHPLPPVP